MRIPFADYMERVLYGPAGYYSSGVAKSGKSGDYFTAPDVGVAFGQILAALFQSWEKRLNVPSFSLTEVGAGEGRLAQDILNVWACRYQAVEKSPTRQQVLGKIQGIYVCPDLESLASAPAQGVLFSNELVDAFPVHRVQMKGGTLRELFVEESGDRRKFIWDTPSTPKLQAYFDRLQIQLPEGYETEVNLAMAEWLERASRVFEKGLLVFIDYGRAAQDYYAPERTRGTLRAFSKHRVSADFLNPGQMVDLTADVDFTSLALDARQAGFQPLAFMELGSFLLRGVEVALQSNPTFAPKGLRYLLHPEGMGSAFHVLVLGQKVDPADWMFEHNRLSWLALPA